MAKVVWVSDPHLNFLRVAGAVKAFGQYLASEQPEADMLLVTGDISESPGLVQHLTELVEGFQKPTYVTLGNHDHYGDSIEGTNAKMAALNIPNLVWLDAVDPLVFDDFALVGQYSWYDALNGRPQQTQVVLYDFQGVEEFGAVFNEFEWVYQAKRGSRNALLKILRELAKQAVAHVRPKLERALQLKQHVLFATHVPPFEQAAWHRGKPSDPDWQPWFSCKQMGDMLIEVAAQHPEHKILVLCGHSHSPGSYQPASNLKVLTAKAVYGAPDVAGILQTPFHWW